MAVIDGLTEKTAPVIADVIAGSDSQDSNKSKKFSFQTIANFVISKFTATLAEINAVCSGNTATATEITQICDGRIAGGTGVDDIVTVGGSQLLANKGMATPTINGGAALTSTSTELNQLGGVIVGGTATTDIVTLDATQTLRYKKLRDVKISDDVLLTVNGTKLNTLTNVTGTGRVNEVQQGLEVGNATLTTNGTITGRGLTLIDVTTQSQNFGLDVLANWNYSEQIEIINTSGLYAINLLASGGDNYWEKDVEISAIAISAGHGIIVTPTPAGYMIVARGKSTVTTV
jgi:hypothetical protein